KYSSSGSLPTIWPGKSGISILDASSSHQMGLPGGVNMYCKNLAFSRSTSASRYSLAALSARARCIRASWYVTSTLHLLDPIFGRKGALQNSESPLEYHLCGAQMHMVLGHEVHVAHDAPAMNEPAVGGFVEPTLQARNVLEAEEPRV